MKKILLVLLVVVFYSCESAFSRYCASCTEQTSGYVAEDYCGTSSSVDIYINDLESYDPAYPDQYWSCYKFRE